MTFTIIKALKSSRTEYVILLTFSRRVSFTFLWNKLKLIEYNNSFATRCCSAEIIKKKIWKLFKRRDNEKISRIFSLI